MDDQRVDREGGRSVTNKPQRWRVQFGIFDLLMAMFWWSLFGGLISTIWQIEPRKSHWSYLARATYFYASYALFYALPCIAVAAMFGKHRRGIYVGLAVGILFAVLNWLTGMDTIRK